jgi:transcriptional regulator with XRE-family HTH domain
MSIGATIKLIRQSQRKSQADLAERLHIQRTYLSQVESGQSQPSLSLLKELAVELNVPPALLLIDEGNPQDPILEKLQAIFGMVLQLNARESSRVTTRTQATEH